MLLFQQYKKRSRKDANQHVNFEDQSNDNSSDKAKQ